MNASLQGALGRTSGRINMAAPRQMLRVDGSTSTASPSLASALPVKNHEELTRNAGKAGREAMNVREVRRKCALSRHRLNYCVVRPMALFGKNPSHIVKRKQPLNDFMTVCCLLSSLIEKRPPKMIRSHVPCGKSASLYSMGLVFTLACVGRASMPSFWMNYGPGL